MRGAMLWAANPLLAPFCLDFYGRERCHPIAASFQGEPDHASDLTSNQSKTSSRRDFLKASTATMMERPGLELAVGYVHAGGTIVIESRADRLWQPAGGGGRGPAETASRRTQCQAHTPWPICSRPSRLHAQY